MSDRSEIGICGDGRLALAVAHLAASHGQRVWLFTPNEQRRKALKKTRTLPEVLPEVDALHRDIVFTDHIAQLAQSSRLIFLAGGQEPTEMLLKEIGPALDGSHLVVHAIHQVYGDKLETTSDRIRHWTCSLQIGALAGPIHVGELLRRQPNAAVIGSAFPAVTKRMIRACDWPGLRLHTNRDLAGVELAAALVQVVSVAVGLSDALQLGAATHATLMARGMAELARLGESLGASPKTFYGMVGLAKLIDGARRGDPNYDAGKLLQSGRSKEQILDETPDAYALSLVGDVHRFAQKASIDVPIVSTLDAVTEGKIDPKEGMQALMSLELKS